MEPNQHVRIHKFNGLSSMRQAYLCTATFLRRLISLCILAVLRSISKILYNLI